jgi:hypothetical protein
MQARAKLWLIGLAMIFAGVAALSAGRGPASGPHAGETMPGTFAPWNINGAHAGKYHCLVCEFDLDPAVLIFAREPAEGKGAAFDELLQKLDQAVARHQKAHFHAGVVVLSPFAQSSTSVPKVEDFNDLVKEANEREALVERLKKRAEALKGTAVACFPAEGPKSYKIDPKAQFTVLFYKNLQVIANYSFAANQMQSGDVATIMKKVDETLGMK